jgi:hypothetical protein
MSFVFALCCNAHSSFAASIRRKLLMQAFEGEVHGSCTPAGITSKAMKQRSTAVMTVYSSNAGLFAGLSIPVGSTPAPEVSCRIYTVLPTETAPLVFHPHFPARGDLFILRLVTSSPTKLRGMRVGLNSVTEFTAADRRGRNGSRRGCGRRGLCRGNRRSVRRVWLLQRGRCSGNRNFPVSRAGFSG